MSEHIQELLARALQAASQVVQARLDRQVATGQGEEPAASALLRFDLSFESGGMLTWFVSNDDATGFSDLLIGGSGDRGAVLTEMHLDALSDACSTMLERAVEGINASLTLPLTAGSVDMGMEGGLPDAPSGGIRAVSAIEIEGFGAFTVVQDVDGALVTTLRGRIGSLDQSVTPDAAAAAAGQTQASPDPAATGDGNVVELPSLREASAASGGDLQMLLDVPLQVTVELGRTERRIRQILDLNVGSILELDKLAGDPMDILVNGKVLARGEVVVIDEDFGIRITEILTPEQRLRNLG